MKELIIKYYHSKSPKCQVCYRSNSGMQETERYPFKFKVSKENRKLIQWYLEEYLTYPYGAFKDRAKNAEDVINNLGTKLFNEIFNNKKDINKTALRFYDRVMSNPSNCQMIIEADHSAGWSLPWEFIYDPNYTYLARILGGFVRSQSGVGVHLNPIQTDNPIINILMIISRPSGEEDVPFQSIARPLMKIFRPHKNRIKIDVLRPPTFEQLQKVLAEKPNFYNILHFDGHGVFPDQRSIDYLTFLSQKGIQGQLLFEKTGGGKRFVTGKEFSELLQGKGISVVMLNACQSGMTHPETLFPSIGGELIKTGAVGVVAMAYSVYVHTAAKFMAQVYESLLNGQTLARAVSIGREGLAVRDKRESPIGPISIKDWVVPVLFQSAKVQFFRPPEKKLQLDIEHIKDEQVIAGMEINLPKQPDYGFIGRDEDIWKLEKAFEKETIVLLQAMAGMGKTTTAVGFARWWEETGALKGHVFFFSFESYKTFDNICNQIGNLFQNEIKIQIGIEWHLLEISKRRKLIIEILRHVPCLLIWDNFEPVAGFPKGTPSPWKEKEQQDLKDFLHDLNGGKTKVIITSRRDEKWIGKCYQNITLYGLNKRDRIELAGKVIDRASINRQNLKPYNKLLDYLQGNPLAIQVILPELKYINPDDLLNDLQKGTAMLKKDDKEQGREHSLSASLEYRLDKLDKLLRNRLGILGLFQGFVNTNVLALICEDESVPELLKGLDENEWKKMLEQITEIGLLQKIGTNIYKIHPAIPWFFHDILQKTYHQDTEWLEQRFVNVFGEVSGFLQNLLHNNAETALILLNFEELNFWYAIRLGCKYKMWDSVNKILYGITEMLGRQSRRSELELLNLEIINLAANNKGEPLNGAKNLYGTLWFNLGGIAEERRQFDDAEKWYRKSLKIDQKLNDEIGQGITLHQLGIIAVKRRQFDEAEKLCKKSLKIGERLNDEHSQVATLHQLGIIAEERRQFEEAEKWYRKSLKINEKLNDEYGKEIILHQLGMIAEKRGQFDEAEKLYRKSLKIEEKLNDELGQAKTLHQLGRIAEDRMQFDEAESWYKKSLKIKEKLNDELGQAKTLHQLGMIAQKRNQFDEAEKWYRKNLKLAKKSNDEYLISIINKSLKRLKKETN